MSWYGNYNQSTRQLDAILDQKPTLSDLLSYSDFTQQLKAFNPKLLDYLSNSPDIPKDIVTYVSVSPLQSDSRDRKYRLPLQTVEMVETQTTCIINSLLKETAKGRQTYFQSLFEMLRQPTVLPLLAGYFFRVNLAMCRSRYKETLELIFSSPQYFELLIKHAEMEPISQCISLYLCVETSKNIPLSEERTNLKVATIRKIMDKIEMEQKKGNGEESVITVENLIHVIRETIEKYYLLADGKILLQVITEQRYVSVVIGMISYRSGYSFPAMQLCLSYIKYYSLSSFNSEEGTEEMVRKNMERLESQPFVSEINGNFANLLRKVVESPTMDIYCFKLTEVLCHCMTLSSVKMFETIRKAELYPILIDLLFKYEKCNILHKLIERAFLHIFVMDKKIYDRYKKYLFCDISIIDLTVKRLLNLYPEPAGLDQARKKPYFGVFIKIIKIYSGIQTMDPEIRDAITSKSDIWNKMSKRFIKPYENLCKEELGNYQNVSDPPPIEYTVKKNEIMYNLVGNILAVEEIQKEEESMNKNLELSSEIKKEETLAEPLGKIEDDTFFNVPIEQSLQRKNSEKETESLDLSQKKGEGNKSSPMKNKSQAFSDFMSKKMAEAETQIKLQRTQSGQKRLSAGKKTRMTSPSPTAKRKKWNDDDKEEQKPNNKISLTKDLPKIPLGASTNKGSISHHSSRSEHSNVQSSAQSTQQNLAKSSVSQNISNVEQAQNKRKYSLSMANLQSLKKTTIKRINVKPNEKKYRKFEEKDKALFAFLGINF